MLLCLNVNAQTDGLEIRLPDGVFVVVNHPGELKSKIPGLSEDTRCQIIGERHNGESPRSVLRP